VFLSLNCQAYTYRLSRVMNQRVITQSTRIRKGVVLFFFFHVDIDKERKNSDVF